MQHGEADAESRAPRRCDHRMLDANRAPLRTPEVLNDATALTQRHVETGSQFDTIAGEREATTGGAQTTTHLGRACRLGVRQEGRVAHRRQALAEEVQSMAWEHVRPE